jgi:serine/threonine protein kinase/tetratricopeptide (TPR) repeat protein
MKMSPERWQQIEAVFQSAADLSPHERDAFVAAACRSDEELKSEVLKLLSSFDSANDFIEAPVWTDGGFLNSSAKKVLSDPAEANIHVSMEDQFIGRQIGVYRVSAEIGKGGMGAVYLAERADGEFTQKVAIKLIKRGMDSDFIIRRFRHERQILASFEHPYIARLLDGGTTPEGIPYFVMEYIEGQTLYQYCDKRRLDVRARVKIFQKVCSAIEYAHERQIIHRDIKPSNILINKYGNPKLLDFGIAKVLDPELIHESINPTASIMRMMTPDYASPEQVQGTEVTPSSDIYSLGILLYELLTGHRPYNFTGRALHEVSRVICEITPKPPSEILDAGANVMPQYLTGAQAFADARAVSIAGLQQELRGNLDNIVMKAISKDPQHRYVSAKEFADDLARYMKGETVFASRSFPDKADEPYRHLSSATNTKALAILPFRFISLSSKDDTDDRFLGLGLADALISRLSKVRRFVVRPTSSIISFGGDASDPIKAGHDLNVDYILDGNIKKAGDRLRVTVQLLNVKENAAVWAATIDEVIADVFALEDTLSKKLIEVLLPQLTGSELEEYSKRSTESPEAFEHYIRGRYYFNTFTEEGLAKAFVSFHRAIAADPEYAHAYSGIADYYNWLGIIGVLPPDECFPYAIEAASKAVSLDAELSEAHSSLGFSLHAGNHDWASAERHLRRAIELNPGNANAYVWYSIVLYTEGRFTDGLEFARRSVDLDPLAAFNHHNIGWGLYYARRFDEAAAQYKKVTSDFPDYGFGYYGLSKVHRITGETSDAVSESIKATQLMDGSIFSRLAEAESLAADGRREDALALLEELERASETRFVSPYQLSLVFCFLEEKEKAIASLERSAKLKEPWLNWLGVEPVFDTLRGDNRLDSIAEPFSYQGWADTSVSGRNISGPSRARETQFDEYPQLHNVTTLVIDGPATGDVISDTQPAPFAARPGRLVFATLALLALIISSIAVYHFVIERYLGTDPGPAALNLQNASIIILPFTSDDSASSDIGVGLADALTSKLGNIKALQVISASSGRDFVNADPQEIGRELGVSFVLKGKLSGPPNAQAVSAMLINARDGKTVWSADFPGPNDDLFAIQKEVAEKVWTSLGVEPLPLERQQVYKRYTTNTQAYQFYLIGRYQMVNRSSESLRHAIETFNTSVRFDPGFALPYVGLADSYALLNLYDVEPPPDAYEKASEYARKALVIDDDLAEAHASLAYIKFYHEHDRTGAELEFRRAIQLNPSYAQAHHWFALALTALNRPVEAITEAQVAQRLDPRSPAIRAATGIVFFMSGRNAEALAECDEALAMNEGFVPALKVKRWTYTAMGERQKAFDTFGKEMTFSGGNITDPGWKIVQLQLVPVEGGRSALLTELQKAINSPEVLHRDYSFAFEIALAFNHLGDRDRAIEWLERAQAASTHSMAFVEIDPRLENLRDDPRYLRIVKKMNRDSDPSLSQL